MTIKPGAAHLPTLDDPSEALMVRRPIGPHRPWCQRAGEGLTTGMAAASHGRLADRPRLPPTVLGVHTAARAVAKPCAGRQPLVMVAALAVVPALLDHLRPTLTSVKIDGLLELSFQHAGEFQADSEQVGTDSLVAQRAAELQDTSTDDMTVLAVAEELAQRRVEVLQLDLGTGRTWWFPNLYVLALLLRRSPVSSVAFVEGSASAKALAGVCTLENLLAALKSRMPEFTRSAQNALGGPGVDFDHAARELPGCRTCAPVLYGVWVNGASLRERLPGSVLEYGTVDWPKELTQVTATECSAPRSASGV
jgi:hypothetical protein